MFPTMNFAANADDQLMYQRSDAPIYIQNEIFRPYLYFVMARQAPVAEDSATRKIIYALS